MIHVDWYLRRLWIFGVRIHHALVGALLALLGARLHRLSLIAVGLALVIDDRNDIPRPRRYR